MTTQNLTKLILLGLLYDFNRPIHGYEIKKIITEWSISEFSNISYGSLYYNLEKMEGDQLVESQTLKDSDRPERRIYKITEIGKKKFLEMLRKNYFVIQSIRYPFDIGVLFMPALPKKEILEAINKRIEKIESNNAMHNGLLKMLEKKIPFFSIFIIKHHLYHWKAEKEWLIALRDEVKKRVTI